MYGFKYCRVDCSISRSSFSFWTEITVSSSLILELYDVTQVTATQLYMCSQLTVDGATKRTISESSVAQDDYESWLQSQDYPARSIQWANVRVLFIQLCLQKKAWNRWSDEANRSAGIAFFVTPFCIDTMVLKFVFFVEFNGNERGVFDCRH